MEISLNKAYSNNHPMNAPAVMENQNEAGSIYLVIHRPKIEAKDNESNQTEKTLHFCVAVDITGSSTAHEFVATHYDLYVKSPTDYTTYIQSELKRRTWDHYHLVRKVGRISFYTITQFDMPHQFATDLHNRLLQQVYSPLLRANNGPHWSSVFNCQTMTRASIQFLGYQFPNDIQLITDIVPTMVDRVV